MKKMEQVKHTQKVKQLIKTIKKELNTGYIPIFDKYSISAKELSLLYKEDPDKIYRALSDMKSSDSIAEFEKNLIKHIELGKKEWEKWNIFIPYDLDGLKRSFKFGQIEFKLTSKNRFLRELKNRKIGSRFNKALEIYNGRFFKVQVYAKNYLHASEIIENDFYLIRGIIEFSDNVYISKSSTDLENLVSLSHPKYIFYISDHKCEYLEYYVPPCSKFSHSLTLSQNGKSNLNLVQDRLKILKKNNFDIYHILESTFRMYTYAMEEEYSHNRFLRFWQIAELIGTSGNTGKKDKAVKVLTFFIKQTDKFKNIKCELVLADFLKKRNLYVHEGINNITKSDALNIKVLIEVGIEWLIDFSSVLKTRKHLEEFNRLQFQSPDINITKQIIKLVK